MRVPPSPSTPAFAFLSLPKDSSTGVVNRVTSRTKSTVRELVRPTHFIGRMGMIMKDIREMTVVRPQNTTDQPISLTVSTTASLRFPCARSRWAK